jgi:hypothetical protein
MLPDDGSVNKPKRVVTNYLFNKNILLCVDGSLP